MLPAFVMSVHGVWLSICDANEPRLIFVGILIYMQAFEVEKITESLVQYVREQLAASGGERAVLGISGGKDSSVAAALLAKAIGPDRVYGVLMPDGVQHDLDDAQALVRHLGIPSFEINIAPLTTAFHEAIAAHIRPSEQAQLNAPPRIRMTILFGIAQSLANARVINTSNLSEDWVGYATLYGDTAGAFSPLGMLTSAEVMAIGKHLGLPEALAAKVPADGLTGKSDEDIFGFSYDVLNHYIRTGEIADPETKATIDRLHRMSRFKFQPLPMFDPQRPIVAKDIAHVYGRGDDANE